MKVLHLSDLHFGNESSSIDEAKEARALKSKIIKRWGNSKNKPLILITGDVVDDGERYQMEDAQREFFSPLRKKGFRLLAVPGNHDYGWNGGHAKAKRFKDFKEILIGPRSVTYPDVPDPINCGDYDLILIGLNSMKAETGRYDGWLADGELGDDQLNVLGERLENVRDHYTKDTVVLVYLHHHPFLYPDDTLYEKVKEYAGHYLKDGSDLMNILSGKIDILLFGHEHRHFNFSRPMKKKVLTEKYKIPVILSCDKSTKPSHPAWLITINGPGKCKAGEF